ncbi:MAG: hypothetical protein MR902_08755 [Campylobacter sp.]|nr:hypothetical protein [Campylobacter sp.]
MNDFFDDLKDIKERLQKDEKENIKKDENFIQDESKKDRFKRLEDEFLDYIKELDVKQI